MGTFDLALRMKICFIADPDSVHTIRLTEYFASKDYQVFLLAYNEPSSPIRYKNIKFFSLIDRKTALVSKTKDSNEKLGSSTHHSFVLPLKLLKSKLAYCFELLYAFQKGYFYWLNLFDVPILRRYTMKFMHGMERYIFKAKDIVNEIQPDIIYGHFLTSYGYIASRIDFTPLILSPWGSDVLIRPKDFLYKMMLRHTLKKSDIVTGFADFFDREMIRYGADEEKIKRLIWGIDMKKFFPLPEKDHLLPTIIHTRALAPLYNVEKFIKSLPMVMESIPDLKVYLKNTGPKKSDIEMLIKELNLESLVVLLDWLPEEELANHYRNSHLYVSLSKSDGASVSLLEAMASGCFPVVLDIPANKEWIEDGINGFIVLSDDPKVLANRIVQAFENRELRIQAGRKNIEIIKSRAMWGDQVRNLEKIFSSVSSMIT